MTSHSRSQFSFTYVFIDTAGVTWSKKHLDGVFWYVGKLAKYRCSWREQYVRKISLDSGT